MTVAHWQQRRLGEISQIYSGFAFRSQDLGDNGIPVIKIANIQNKRVSSNCADHLPEELCTTKLSRYFLRTEDTLIAMTGAGSVGKVGKMPNVEGRFLVNQRVAIVRPDSFQCVAAFVYYALSQDIYENKLYSLGLGAGQPNVSAKQIGELEIPFPPFSVQQRIADILSAYDELIENNQRRIKILESMARALYREWFVHFRFPGHENHPRVVSPVGEIPKGWEIKPIQQFGKVLTGKTPSKANENFYGDDVPFLKTPDMHGHMFILDTNEHLSILGAESQANKTIPAGSICVSCIGTIGVVSITTEDSQTNQQINSVVLLNPESREFLFLRLQDSKQELQNLGSNGATMGNVNKSKFEALEIICPTANLLEEYHHLAEPMFLQILALSRQVRNLRRTRDLLLPRLLSGQIDVEGADHA